MSSTGNAEEIRTNKREEKTSCNCPPRGGANAILYDAIQYLALPCNTIQYSAVSCPPKGEPGKEQVPMQSGAGKIKKFCTEYLYCVKTFTARYGIFLLLVRLSF